MVDTNRPRPSVRQQVDHAGGKEEEEAAAHRDLEPEDRHHRDQHHVEHADERVGQELADDQLPASQRRDVELLERADLALADDGHRGEVGGHDQQQQRDDARHHEVAALQPRVEPDADVGADRRRALAAGLPLGLAFGGVGGDDAAGVAERHGRGVGIGAVGDDLHRPRPAGGDVGAEPRRNRQGHPGLAALERRFDQSGVADHVDDHEVGRGVEAADQPAAGLAAVAVDDQQRHVLDVGGGGVAQHRQLDDRRQHDDAEQARIGAQLDQLLADQVRHPRQGRRHALTAIPAAAAAR